MAHGYFEYSNMNKKHHTYILVSEKEVKEIEGDFGRMVPIHIHPEDFDVDKVKEITEQAVKLFHE